MDQQSFSSLDYAHKKKRTKREVFLGEMDAVVLRMGNTPIFRGDGFNRSLQHTLYTQ